LFVPNQGILALVTPLSFVFGTLFYANILLPQHFELLLSGKRYPELMASSSKSSFVRIIVSLYVVFSLWLFTYTEIQAFITFIAGDSNGYMTTASLFFGIVICATMGIYVARSGLSGVIASDESQFHAITIGSLALLVLVLISAFGEGYEKLTAIFFSQTAMIRSYPYTSLISLLIDTLAGFAFCQLLYYDNWQRISAYSALRALSDHNAS
jgi:predicted exporter